MATTRTKRIVTQTQNFVDVYSKLHKLAVNYIC